MPTPSLSDQRQIDIVCDQFENQWDANRRPNFSSFTDLVDDALREVLLHMLLEIDVELRTRAKQTIEVADYHTTGEAASLYVRELLENKNTSHTELWPSGCYFLKNELKLSNRIGTLDTI